MPKEKEGIRSGVWSTPGGTKFKIKVSGNSFIGTYQTTSGRPDPSRAFYCKGTINSDLIGAVVSFEEYLSLTCWTGRYELHKQTEQECIRAVWHYGRLFSDKENTIPIDAWCVFHVGEGYYFWDTELTEDDEILISSLQNKFE